jgi:hypothetical protein
VFDYYKKYFLTALLDGGNRRKAVEKLLAWHNEWIFPDAKGYSDGSSGSDDDVDDEMAEALKALDMNGSGSNSNEEDRDFEMIPVSCIHE